MITNEQLRSVAQELFEGVSEDTRIVETKYMFEKFPVFIKNVSETEALYEYELIELKRYHHSDLKHFAIGFGPKSNVLAFMRI